jgi:hypothetical protein
MRFALDTRMGHGPAPLTSVTSGYSESAPAKRSEACKNVDKHIKRSHVLCQSCPLPVRSSRFHAAVGGCNLADRWGAAPDEAFL